MTSASACRSACAAAIPAKPPPMITTRFRFLGAGSGAGNFAFERVSSKAIVILVTMLRGAPNAWEQEGASAGAGNGTACRRLFLGLGAQLEQPEQNLVALRRQFINRA